MKSINILSRDTLFAEMLAIELREAGYNATVGKTFLPDLVIIDLDSMEVVQGFSVLTFSREKDADIRRPFNIDDLISLVMTRLNAEEKEYKASLNELYVSETERYAVFRNKRVELSELEHKLLLILYHNRGNTVTSEEISKNVFDCEGNLNLVRVYVNYLRQKLDRVYDVRMIETLRGKGYMLRRDME